MGADSVFDEAFDIVEVDAVVVRWELADDGQETGNEFRRLIVLVVSDGVVEQ
jgi:hypothetical protein